MCFPARGSSHQGISRLTTQLCDRLSEKKVNIYSNSHTAIKVSRGMPNLNQLADYFLVKLMYSDIVGNCFANELAGKAIHPSPKEKKEGGSTFYHMRTTLEKMRLVSVRWMKSRQYAIGGYSRPKIDQRRSNDLLGLTKPPHNSGGCMGRTLFDGCSRGETKYDA